MNRNLRIRTFTGFSSSLFGPKSDNLASASALERPSCEVLSNLNTSSSGSLSCKSNQTKTLEPWAFPHTTHVLTKSIVSRLKFLGWSKGFSNSSIAKDAPSSLTTWIPGKYNQRRCNCLCDMKTSVNSVKSQQFTYNWGRDAGAIHPSACSWGILWYLKGWLSMLANESRGGMVVWMFVGAIARLSARVPPAPTAIQCSTVIPNSLPNHIFNG